MIPLIILYSNPRTNPPEVDNGTHAWGVLDWSKKSGIDFQSSSQNAIFQNQKAFYDNHYYTKILKLRLLEFYNKNSIFKDEIYNFRRIRVAPLMVVLGFILCIFSILYKDKK